MKVFPQFQDSNRVNNFQFLSLILKNKTFHFTFKKSSTTVTKRCCRWADGRTVLCRSYISEFCSLKSASAIGSVRRAVSDEHAASRVSPGLGLTKMPSLTHYHQASQVPWESRCLKGNDEHSWASALLCCFHWRTRLPSSPSNPQWQTCSRQHWPTPDATWAPLAFGWDDLLGLSTVAIIVIPPVLFI